MQQGLNGYSGAADNWIIAYSGADINKGSTVDVDMRANSDYGLAYTNLGFALNRIGQYEEAIRMLEKPKPQRQ